METSNNFALFADLGKAVKTRRYKVLFYFTLMCLSVLTLICFFVLLFISIFSGSGSIFLAALVPAGVVGLYYAIRGLPRARADLIWVCEHCGAKMDAAYHFLEKDVCPFQNEKSVVTGSHYEFSRNDDGNLIARKVLETSTASIGFPTYDVAATVKVILTCGSCMRQKSFVIKSVYFTEDVHHYEDAQIKEAIIEKLTLQGFTPPRSTIE